VQSNEIYHFVSTTGMIRFLQMTQMEGYDHATALRATRQMPELVPIALPGQPAVAARPAALSPSTTVAAARRLAVGCEARRREADGGG